MSTPVYVLTETTDYEDPIYKFDKQRTGTKEELKQSFFEETKQFFLQENDPDMSLYAPRSIDEIDEDEIYVVPFYQKSEGGGSGLFFERVEEQWLSFRVTEFSYGTTGGLQISFGALVFEWATNLIIEKMLKHLEPTLRCGFYARALFESIESAHQNGK